MYDPTVNNEKEHAPASQPSQANALAHVELEALRAAHVSPPSTLASRDPAPLRPTTSVHKGFNLLLGVSLYISKRTDDCWKSRSVIASMFGAPLQVIDLINRSVRDSLLDFAGKRASANLKTVLLSNIIESQPRQAHTFIPFLLDGSCHQRYALASRLVSQFSKSFIIDNFVHCTPSKFGITDQVLQERLYAEIFHSSRDERQSCILQPQDTLAISKFDRDFQVQTYAWLLETAGSSSEALKNIELSEREYVQAYGIFLSRISEQPERFYQSLVHRGQHVIPIQNASIRLSLFQAFYELSPIETLHCIAHFNINDCRQEALSELVRSIYEAGHHGITSKIPMRLISSEVQEHIITDTIQNGRGALYYEELSSWFPLSEKLHKRLFLGAVQMGLWDHATYIAGLNAAASGIQVTPTVRKGGCSRLLSDSEIVPNSITSNFKRLVDAKFLPCDKILSALKFFGPPHADFIIRLITTYGPTRGTAIVEQLCATFNSPNALTDEVKQCLRAYLDTGFRSFSSKTFSIFVQRWRESPQSAKEEVRQWQKLSRLLAENRPLNSTQMEHPAYIDCAIDVYKPIGIARDRISVILRKVRDHSKHLDGFVLEDDGYPVTATKRSQHPITDNAITGRKELHKIFEGIFHPDEPHRQPISPVAVVRLALKSNISELRQQRAAVLKMLIAQMPQHLAYQLYKSIQRSIPIDAPDTVIDSSMLPMLELLDRQYNDLIRSVLPGEIKQQDANDPRLARNIRRILKLSPTDSIGENEFLEALTVELGKLFAPDIQILKKHLKTSSHNLPIQHYGLVGYITKSKHSFLGRAAAGLCTSVDYTSWNDKSWFQMNVFDSNRSHFIANIQFNVFRACSGEKALLGRFNPTARAMYDFDRASLAQGMLAAAFSFADANRLTLFTPENTNEHLLSNDEEFAAILQTFQRESIPCRIQLATMYACHTAYRTIRP